MVSRSFKSDLKLRPTRYRTPSPPRYAYEYGSPTVADYSLITPKFKDESVGHTTAHKAQPPILNHAQKRSYDRMRRGSANVMEEFASIALATAADQAFQQTDPFYSPGYTQATEYIERPHKRSRSEKLPSPQHTRKSSRPVTSYYQHTQPSAENDRERDAALLLNFFQEARSNAQAMYPGWYHDKFCRSPTAESVTLISTAEPIAPNDPAQVIELQHPQNGSYSHIVHHPALGDIIENGTVYEHQPQLAGDHESYKQHTENGVDGAQKTLEIIMSGSVDFGRIENQSLGLEEIVKPTTIESTHAGDAFVDQATTSNQDEGERNSLEIEVAVEPTAKEIFESLGQPGETVESGVAEGAVRQDLITAVPIEEPFITPDPIPIMVEESLSNDNSLTNLDSGTDKVSEVPAQETYSVESAIDPTSGSSSTKSRQSVLPSVCASCNFSRNNLTIDTENNATSWICCDACKDWYHFACAGFKNEREVRGVDKYRCKACKPKHGATTFVRKSARAHTAIDYAGLNEGVVKTSDENPEHHYIKPIKEGVIKFNPESFARMHPSLVTLEYFEKGDGMKEPVVIPASMNPRPQVVERFQEGDGSDESFTAEIEQNAALLDKWLAEGLECESVPDHGQDAMDMVMPQNLTVRQVSELYGPDEKLDVIDVKSQEGEDKRWNLKKWADYYESTGSNKKVRNVISLEVSHSKLGRLIRRPKVVRDLDLQDSVWPAELKGKGEFPKVQFYCLMSVADCFTDFHIDFGGSSVFYHILKGKKTFFFIPPHEKHLKSYEEWCKSPAQNWTFLGDQTKECYRVDLSEGDTMLIPSGWIHAVWTPEDSLVIGGNFLTRMHFDMQIRVVQIEKATNVIMKFRYPFFQRIMWFTALKYLENDPLPEGVMEELVHGGKFVREVETYNEFDTGESSELSEERSHARYYSKAELDGLPGLARYLQRTALIAAGTITDGISEKTRAAVKRSIPKGHGDPIDLVKKFTIWAYWKRGNEPIPHWAYPDYVPEAGAIEVAEKKLSAKTLRRLDREAALQAFRVAPSRQSARMKSQRQSVDTESITEKGVIKHSEVGIGLDGTDRSPQEADLATTDGKGGDSAVKSISVVIASQTGEPNGQADAPKKKRKSTGPPPKRRKLACESCRKRRRACKHGEATAIASYQALNSSNSLDLGIGPSTKIVVSEPPDGNQVQPTMPPTDDPSMTVNGFSPPIQTKAKMLHVEIVRIPSNLVLAITTNGPTKNTGNEATAASHPFDAIETTRSMPDQGENQARTPGRSKACLDCRKSKVRSIRLHVYSAQLTSSSDDVFMMRMAMRILSKPTRPLYRALPLQRNGRLTGTASQKLLTRNTRNTRKLYHHLKGYTLRILEPRKPPRRQLSNDPSSRLLR